jgi:DUF1365 family protein
MSKQLADLNMMKQHLQQQRREADKAEGRKSAILDQLQSEFGLKGLKEAAAEVKALEARRQQAKDQLEGLLDQLAAYEPDEVTDGDATE